MKGTIKPDHIPVNRYKLLVLGLPELTITKQSGLEQELETVDLPDRTVASGGQKKTVEFTIEMPAHHAVEQAAMELWFRESQDPVLPTYKKSATLIQYGISGTIRRTRSLIGLFPSKPKDSDLDMSNEGEMAVVEWTMKGDDIKPIPV